MKCVMEARNGFCDGCDTCDGAGRGRRCCIPDCDALIPNTSELPVCSSCGIKIALIHQFDASRVNAVKAEEHRRRQAEAADAEATRQAVSWVYYVDLGPYIKIGYTSSLSRRLAQLRVYPDRLLAIEPGGREVEKARHQQFSAARVDAREHFARTLAVMGHIAELRAEHDLPLWAKRPNKSLTISQVDP